MSSKTINTVVAAAAAAALAMGAYALGTSQSSETATASNLSAQQPGTAPGAAGAQGARGGPGMGTPVTGATADKVGKAVLAKHPGTIERIVKLADGSYVAHVVTSSGELHVTVSKTFQVTGTQQRPQGGPPQGGMPQGTAPQGTAPQGTAPQGRAPQGGVSSGQSPS